MKHYSRYLTYHFYNMLALSLSHDDLVMYGTSASRSGQAHSKIPGDQIIEVTVNKAIKARAGPMKLGYSTNL